MAQFIKDHGKEDSEMEGVKWNGRMAHVMKVNGY
jgi:hypothetical protein